MKTDNILSHGPTLYYERFEKSAEFLKQIAE